MKKFYSFLMAGMLLPFDCMAEEMVPDDEVVTTAATNKSNTSMSGSDYFGLGFFSYDGGSNYGLSYGVYYYNGIGMGSNLRANFKSSNASTFNADFALNFSIGIHATEDMMFLITPEIGPSLGSRKAYDEKDNKMKDKFFIDGFIGIKAVIVYKKFVLSAGYHVWSSKWKFGEKDKADGFYAQLGFDF